MKGTVQRISEKNWNGKVLYSAQVDGAWYGSGETNPGLQSGDVIEFEYRTTPAGRNNFSGKPTVIKTGTVVLDGGAGKRPAFPRNDGGKDAYWREREERDIATQSVIQLQSSRNSAIAACDLLLKNGAIKLPAAQNKQMDVILALVDEVTSRYEAQATAKRMGDDKPVASEVMETESLDADDGWIDG